MPIDARFMEVLKELREEYAELELELKNETEAHKQQKEATEALFIRAPISLVEKLEANAKKDMRGKQNYILKVLAEHG